MGKPIDKHKPTKNLDELLEHLHKPNDDLDAFEQEALEGFATLESTKEAIEMKQRLDERMEEKFSEKRKPLFIYWSAAAGVALILGLIFLVRSNGDLKEESLADNTVVNEKQLENNINNPPAPPAELKQEAAKKTGNLSGTANSEGESNGSMGGYNKGPVQRLEEQASTKSNDTEIALADEVDDSKDRAKGDKDASDAKPVDDLAKNENPTPAANAPGSGSDANNQKSKAKEDEYKETKATEYFTSRKIKKEKKADAAASQPKSEISGTYEKSNIKAASLTIKETDLQLKIDKFFKGKDYKKSFVCTLTVDADNIVESVVFQNPELFHKGEQKELTEFLKKLKCFKNHEYAVYSTYVLNYKAQ